MISVAPASRESSICEEEASSQRWTGGSGSAWPYLLAAAGQASQAASSEGQGSMHHLYSSSRAVAVLLRPGTPMKYG